MTWCLAYLAIVALKFHDGIKYATYILSSNKLYLHKLIVLKEILNIGREFEESFVGTVIVAYSSSHRNWWSFLNSSLICRSESSDCSLNIKTNKIINKIKLNHLCIYTFLSMLKMLTLMSWDDLALFFFSLALLKFLLQELQCSIEFLRWFKMLFWPLNTKRCRYVLQALSHK